ETIRREAARYGAQITHSELIGLIPQQALIDAAAWYLQLDDFSEEQVLEQQIQLKIAEQGTVSDAGFLDGLAAGTATPGGGSAAAYSGAMAASLTAMVARITIGKKKYIEVEDQMKAVVEQAEQLKTELNAAVAQDSAAFEKVMAAYGLPKVTDAEKAARSEAIQAATMGAAEVPLTVVEKLVKVLGLTQQAAEAGNLNAITDAGSAAALAQAGVTGASLNVRINLGSIKDQKAVKKLTARLADLNQQAERYLAAIRTAVEERGEITY
ncbi:MAG: cyclodeaminase/cyclohydrolase family protein, partial [Chloroflexota bacterium]